MIFVSRDDFPVPPGLGSPRAIKARDQIARFISLPIEELRQRRIPFDSFIWHGARSYLLRLFRERCAYCGKVQTDVMRWAVFHYRPTQGASSIKRERDEHYYAWLAYDWDNLLPICLECERSANRYASVFPVEQGRAPLYASVKECRKLERPLLIDPCYDDPTAHLIFMEKGTVEGRTERGRFTIEHFSLNREELVAARRATWSEAQAFVSHLIVHFLSRNLAAAEALRRQLQSLFNGRTGHVAVARQVVETTWQPLLRLLDSHLDEWESQMTPAERQQLVGFGQNRALVDEGVSPDGDASAPPHIATRDGPPPFFDRHIVRVTIRDFKGIGSLQFDIPRPRDEDYTHAGSLMLLGENATGKSSVLEAVALTVLGTTQIARLGLRAVDFVRRQNWGNQPQSSGKARVEVFVEGEREPIWLEIDATSGTFSGQSEPAMVLLGYGARRFFSRSAGLRRSRHAAARIKSMFDPRAGVTNPTGWLLRCSGNHFNAAIRALRQLLLLQNEGIASRPMGKQNGSTEVMFDVHGVSSPLSSLSDGYKTTVATGVDVIREMLRYWPELESARGVVLIDEIETHLHPRWKMRIMQRLRSSMPGVQFICTTHDPLCLRGMLENEVAVLRRDEEHRISAVTDLPNVRGLTVEQLLLSDFFGLFSTEDPKQESQFISYVTLANNPDRTAEEEAALEQQRRALAEVMPLGKSLEAQLALHAAERVLRERRSVVGTARSDSERRAIEALVQAWRAQEGRAPQ